MRIAFLNPWTGGAENQEFPKNRIALGRIGHELIQCKNSAEVEACAPDFVLVAASTQPKLNDVPHYGIIHEPRHRFLTNRTYFQNLLSYDGYLALADTLEKFLKDVMYATGRTRPVGYYFNTSQRFDTSADLRGLIDRRELLITYFGTNWDHRRALFFRMLSDCPGVQICGPEERWPQINKNAYGGSVPWDGVSVQERYAANGIGVCILSDEHFRDDVISNRIFEITAVGAIAFCCDIPWIRNHFGDSVYYFDQNLDEAALVARILELRDSIYRDPQTALGKAARGREILQTKFSSEILFENVIRYHEQLTSLRASALRTAEDRYMPLISVIIRCGARPLRYVERAVASIAKQTYGRFEVILVRHQELDLEAVLQARDPRFASVRVIECPGGNRSASLWAGLNAVTGEYFSILDDDDWWFSDHFEQLFHPLPEQPLRRFMAYSGAITVHGEPVTIRGGGSDHRELLHFGIRSLESWDSAASAFTSNCFVASSDLLNPRLLMCPNMETAEDSYLILSLMAQAEPRFSFAATSMFDRSSADQSSFSQHPKRFDDELTLQLRLLGADRPRFLPVDAWKSISLEWERRPFFENPRPTADVNTLFSDWELVAAGYDRETSWVVGESSFLDPHIGSASIHTPPEVWAYAAGLALPKPSREASDYTLVVELKVRDGKVGVGVVNREESDFLFRQPLRAKPEAQTLLIPIRTLSAIGRLIIQNWETPGTSLADILSLRLMAAPNRPTS